MGKNLSSSGRNSKRLELIRAIASARKKDLLAISQVPIFCPGVEKKVGVDFDLPMSARIPYETFPAKLLNMKKHGHHKRSSAGKGKYDIEDFRLMMEEARAKSLDYVDFIYRRVSGSEERTARFYGEINEEKNSIHLQTGKGKYWLAVENIERVAICNGQH